MPTSITFVSLSPQARESAIRVLGDDRRAYGDLVAAIEQLEGKSIAVIDPERLQARPDPRIGDDNLVYALWVTHCGAFNFDTPANLYALHCERGYKAYFLVSDTGTAEILLLCPEAGEPDHLNAVTALLQEREGGRDV